MLQQAIGWIRNNHLDGRSIPITHMRRRPYPEVTGYYIPTLLAVGETALAENFARFLVSIQNPDGSFSLDNPELKYVFDTGQVIRGWVAIIDRMPELAQPLKRACDWLINGADRASGRLQTPAPGGDWALGQRGEVSEGIHLYVLKPMRDAATALQLPYIRAAADKALAYYKAHVRLVDFTDLNMLSHFYGYIQEALFELGEVELARQGMASAAAFQSANGAVPAYANVQWVCSTGLAQLAITWYLLGERERADRALAFVAQLQNESGGFYGSYGPGATYFPTEEIPWAVKYAIEAEHLRIASHFDHTAYQYAQTIAVGDGRVQAILATLDGARRVLDAGCGKGRYAALVQQQAPQIDVHAVDVSAEMLRHVPPGIRTQVSTIQNLPYPDGYFDVVYCVEALEHVTNPPAALAEMARVLAPGGRLVVIDKNLAKQGTLQIESWEQWFDVDTLLAQMAAAGLPGSARFVSHNDQPADGLFVAWTGIRDGALPATPRPSVNFYRDTYYDETNRLLVEASRRGDRALIAAHLDAQAQRYPQPHADELYANRVGMQLIAQLLQRTGRSFDVVDVGCGSAALLRQLQQDGHRVRGVDASATRVARLPELAVQQGFGEALPLADHSADVVISQEALSQMADLDLALRECLRVLRPGGVLLCQVPQADFADGSNQLRLFSAATLQAALTGTGFQVLNLWRIAYLAGEAEHSLFLVARKPGHGSAGELLAPLLSALGG
jgi:malonyl-CoA O-methyltransferase